MPADAQSRFVSRTVLLTWELVSGTPAHVLVAADADYLPGHGPTSEPVVRTVVR